MAENGNGHASGGMSLPSIPMESVDFIIGGRAIKLSALSLWDLERAKGPMLALSGELWWADYAKGVCEIIEILVSGESAETLMQSCSITEARALSVTWSELLTKSGFEAPGEDSAASEASPGTGTSTNLSPNSEQDSTVQTHNS
jgi:hypothetical protein